MKAKMLRTQKILYLVFYAGILYVTYYVFKNKDYLIREHLSNPPPTLFSLDKGLTETKEEVETLKKDLADMKAQASAGASQATLAKASLGTFK
jgi:hypothetical protein